MKSRVLLPSALIAAILGYWLLSPSGERLSQKKPATLPQPATAAVAPVAALDLPPMLKEAPAAIADFLLWSGQYLKAPPAGQAALIEAGKVYAQEHTKQIAKMIRSDPQAAIAHAVPMVVRQKLPREIVSLLEERPRLRGDYLVRGNVPQAGQENTTEPYTRQVRSKDGQVWSAYVYGKRQWQRTTLNASLNGISVGLDMAVSDSPLRVLEPGEIPQVEGRQVVEFCPVSGEKTEVEKAEGGELPAVTEETPAYETPEQVAYVCRGGHISEVEAEMLSAEDTAHWATLGVKINAGTGSGPAHGPVGTIPGAWTTGHRTFLYIRCAFPDNPVDPQNEQECYNVLRTMNDYVVQTSYGRCYFTYAVPPLVILPYPLSWYNRYDSEQGGGDFLIQSHARQIAKSMGYDYEAYHLDAVRWDGGPGSYSGAAYVGFRGMWMKTNSAGTFIHELGHNLGVYHANFWRTDPPSVAGPGNNLEYGNIFDVMGSSGSIGQFTASFKNTLSWMPQEQFWNVTSSGLYRLHQTDEGNAGPDHRHALRIRNDAERDYWAEFRQRQTGNTGLMNGLMLTWDRWGSSSANALGSSAGAHLLDMTPGSFGNGITDTRNDSALWVGRTYSDPYHQIHITPVAKNLNTTPPSMDVQVQLGDVPGNTAPTLTLQASTTTTVVGVAVTLTATATDAQGDTLAYAWVFGDGNYSLNNQAVQTKSWAAAGHYQVLCTASDMKGGRTTRSVLITVGSPSTFTVSGTVNDPQGQPMEGVYVANYAPSSNTTHTNSNTFRGTWTDSAGNYVITGLSAGSYTITPNLYPYVFSPVGSAVTVGPSATGRNFASTLLPRITISYPDATAQEAAVPDTATVRLTREGPTTAALAVQMYNTTTGSAIRNSDYTLTPAPTNSGGTSQFTIPAGSSFLDITITPLNNSTAEGVEYAVLDFVNTASGYVFADTPRATVMITDDDSSLPVVRISAVDDRGHEVGADTLTMRLERNGPTTSALTVNLTYSGTANRPADYTAPLAVTIPAGSASTTFTLTPEDDSVIEGTETILVTVATSGTYLRDSTAQSVTGILNDDDLPTVSVVATDASAAEAGQDKGVFTITRTGTTDTSLTVDYSINGRAIMGTDYRRLDGRAVIPAGSSSITVEIVPYDDTLDEGTQDVVLQLRTSLSYAVDLTGAAAATINIADDDAPQIYVELNTGTGAEPASGTVSGPVFQIHRPASGTAMTVNYSISGTATSGLDFNTLPGSINFAAGDTNRTITVTLIADALLENAETVILTLLPGTGYSFLPGQATSATAYIYDGDQEVVDVSVADEGSALTTHVAENSFSGERFLFSRRSTSGDLNVSYTISGTAGNGVDYQTLSGSVTIPSGLPYAYVTVVPIDDTLPEGVESVTLTLTPVSGSYGTRFASATMLIADNDPFGNVSVGHSSGSSTVAESAGSHQIPVQVTGTSSAAVSVQYRVSGGTAAGNGVDFTLPEGVLNFAPGETVKNIPIQIRQDVLPEPDETVIVQLFNAVGADLGPASHTITINNVSLPEAFSDPASGVTPNSMTFNGRVMPGGVATTWWFEYGGTTAYGLTTPVQNLAAGASLATVSAPVTGLTLSSYHFRLVAQNSLGISYGIDQFPGIISEPPVIVDHPQSLAVNEGASADFSITATGGGLSFQWQKDTVDIPLATATTYSIPVTTTASAGSYRCIVTNTDGSVTSNPATLVIVTPPVITQDPQSLALNIGQNAAFSVTATGLFLTYQWQKDEVDMPGQTGQSLNLTAVTTLNDGSYRCVVTNSAGSDTSEPATLTVNGPPTITQQPENLAVSLGAAASFSLAAAGPGLSYQWLKDPGTGFAEIPGEDSATLTIATTAVSDAAAYRCRVSNTLGTVHSIIVTLTVVSPPELVAPLAPTSVNLNETLTFTTTVQVNGLFLNYQWRRDGLTVTGETNPTLSIPNLTDAHSGSYTCRVWNAAGEVITPAVALLVVTPPIIVDEPTDTLAELGSPATLSVTASGPLLSYQWWRNGLPISGGTSSIFTIPSMSQAALGLYYCRVSNSAGSATTRFALVGIQGMPIITRTPYPALVEAGSYLQLEVQADGESLNYDWKLNGKPAGSGAALNIWPYAAKHAGQYIVEIKNALRTATSVPTTVSTVSNMSPALDQTNLKWSTSGPAFWRPAAAFQAKDKKDAMMASNLPNGYFSILGTRVTGPLILKWWQKVSTEENGDYLRVQLDRADALPPVSGEHDWQEKRLTVPAGLHQIDFIYIKNETATAGSDQVWIDMVSTVPAFELTGSAENRLVASGTTVTMDAPYTGTPPASFQWRRKGAAIKGATSAQLVINGIKTTDAGIYDCVLAGVVNGVNMTQTTPPIEIGVVDATPSRKVVKVGTTLKLNAVAVANGLSYQWCRSSGPLQGEKAKSMELIMHASHYSDDYYCVVTNAAGSVNSGIQTVHAFQEGPDITFTGPLEPAVLSGAYIEEVTFDPLPARAPTSFSAKGLPKGLVIHKLTGVISGIPEESRALPYPVTITAANSMSSDTLETSILVHGLGTKTGSFTGLLPRHEQLNQNLGGRVDFTVTSNGSFSGNLTLGTAKHAFKARLETSILNLNQASASFDVARGKSAPVRLTLNITEAGELTGSVALGSETLDFISGWKIPWSKSAPAATTSSFVGTGSPAGCYNFALQMPPEPVLADPKSPQGMGFGSFTIHRETGAATIAGRLADDTSYTCNTGLGPQGQLLLFVPLYTAPALGSVCGQITVASPTVENDNLCSGIISWARPAMTKTKLDPDGFPEPVNLLVDGGRYVAPTGSTGLILGLSTTGVNTASLSFLNGGIGSPPPSPDITITLTAGSKVNYPAPAQNPRKTTLSLVLAKGSISGSFQLEDNNPLDTSPTPKKLPRKVNYQGLLVRGAAGWKGVGYFLLPELPDVTGETLSTTPVHSGEVKLLPATP